MKANQPIQRQGLKWRCKEHPTLPCDIICLDENFKDRVVCFFCVQKNSIPLQNLISMSYVFSTKEHEILYSYPPFKNQELSGRLRDAKLPYNLEEIDGYFKKLREDFEREVQAAQQRAKESFIKQEKLGQKLFEGYKRIAEIEKLKDLIVSEKESAEEDLDSFIKEKWNKAEENRKVMVDLINQYDEMYFSSDEPNRITQEIIQSLKDINFYPYSIELSSQITLIQSTFQQSQQMKISKVDNQIYQVQQGNYTGHWEQIFIDPILNPLKKYILQIELEQKPGTSNNQFLFGLVRDQGKDNNSACNQNMCYNDNSNSYGITKYIRGNPMQSGPKVTGKHSFEIRIHLNQKFLRVACLPDYSSIAELDDPNKIDPKVAYRFFLSMISQDDMMRITNIRAVNNFDEKM